ncbi:MAG: protein kinase [Planctomycetes bacterium]|nr:protein kinase [Planctomycetota bacterium]
MSSPNDLTEIPKHTGSAEPLLRTEAYVPATSQGTGSTSKSTPEVSSSSGTIIDSQFRAADGSQEPLLVTVQHYTAMEGIEQRLENDQLDAGEASLVPGYKLLHRIGKGAFGTVWEAQSTEGDIGQVAIKFFTCSQWEAMHREVSRIARLEGCTGVMSFKQFADKKADPPYYVMPYARNGSLADLLKNRGPLPLREALPLFTRVVQTMAYVHTKSVIHCDLKPANILMNESGEPLVADFGQAQLGSQEPGAFGTMFYMPPEQAAAKSTLPDTNWDVYALGAILFEMLTGKRPRADGDTVRRLASIKDVRARLVEYRRSLEEQPHVSLRKTVQEAAPQNVSEIDSTLATLIERCLAVKPEERPPSAAALLAGLNSRALWARQRPALIAAAAVTIIFLVALAFLGLYSANKIFKQSERAVAENVQKSLLRTSSIASQLIEEKLRDRVEFIQIAAKEAEKANWMKDGKLLAALEKFKQIPTTKGPPLTGEDRKVFNDWLIDQTKSTMPWYHTDKESRGVALIGVVEGRGYWLGRLEANGTPFVNSTNEQGEDFFRKNWSWRDYFNGMGNQFDEKDKHIAHTPIERVHISQVFRSRTHQNLRIDVSAPIRNAKQEIVAIISTNIDVDRDLLRWLGSDRIRAANPEDESVILVNERGCWAWHAKANTIVEHEEDPKPIYQSLDCFHANNAGESVYRDPFPNGEGQDEFFVSSVPLYPYHVGGDDTVKKDDRRWLLAVQVSKTAAEKPLRKLRESIYGIGIAALVVLGSMVLGLWIWWIRTLRRQELMANG